MSFPFIIIPAPHEEERLRSGYVQQYDERICEKLGYPPELPQNVKFEHKPNWREENFLSVQAAHDCRHWGWQIVRAGWIVAQLSGPGLGYYWLHR